MKKVLIGICSFIGAYLAGTFANMTSDRTKDVFILEYISKFFILIYNTVNHILLYPIQLWIILVALVVIYLPYRLIKSRAYLVVPTATAKMLEYRQDKVKDWVWKWGYYQDTSGQYAMGEIIPYCPDCDVKLRINSAHQSSRCPNCEKAWNVETQYILYNPETGATGPGVWEDQLDIRHILEARAIRILKGNDEIMLPAS